MAELYCLLQTEDHHTFFWKWEGNQNKFFFVVAHSETAPKTLVLPDVTVKYLNSELFGH